MRSLPASKIGMAWHCTGVGHTYAAADVPGMGAASTMRMIWEEAIWVGRGGALKVAEFVAVGIINKVNRSVQVRHHLTRLCITRR
jgi:hypothetical protein